MKLKLHVYLPVLAGVLLDLRSAAQPEAQTLYQISSGVYNMVGGIGGDLQSHLPNADQTFVLLKVAPSNRADLTVLGKDRNTVFLSLTNGVVTNGVIQFKYEISHPYPDVDEQGVLNYTVVQVRNTLHITGAMEFPAVCCDIPYVFAHRNLVATELPALKIRVNEVEICWPSSSNCTYQLQYRSGSETESWTNLGPPIHGNDSMVCVSDRIPQDEPQRLYRIVILY